jgi:hypothetical protein
LFGDVSSWQSAKVICEKSAAKLVVIADETENSFIVSSVAPTNYQSMWLGYYKPASNYVTVEGKVPIFTKWKEDQPDVNLGCVVMVKDATSANIGKWKTENCSVGRTYLCKKPL